MATNITSSQLDFATIKNRLKVYLAQQDEFADYNFEASGLSNILDVLAYNTHLNGLTANFALNEAFLDTAQLRSSIVSHANTLGYNSRSRTSAVAYVQLSLNITDVGRPNTITLPLGTKFNTSIDGVTYTFQTWEAYTATDNGVGLYQFKTGTGSTSIPIVEGTIRTKTFFVGPSDERQIYVIPDQTIDTSTAIVNVYLSNTSTQFNTYSPLSTAVVIEDDSRLYQLKETPIGNYELIFSDGVTTGLAPVVGEKIVLTYLSSNGAVGNGSGSFTANSAVTVNGSQYNLIVSTVSGSTGGSAKETIESIRQNAPITFAAQQRLVTAQDYKALILANYPSVVDCIAWGGEENIPVEYGKVFVSLNFDTDVTEDSKNTVKADIINNLVRPLSVMSIGAEFIDPETTYLECQAFFTYNPELSPNTLNTTENIVTNTIVSFFETNLKTYSKVFRRSNLLAEIDDINQAILNSRMNVKIQQRFTPTLGTSNKYTVNYPVVLASPDDVNYIITSNNFVVNSLSCNIRNKLGSTTLQVIDTDGNVVIDNLGSYNPSNGSVNITGLNVSSILAGETQIKLSAVPANQSTIRPLRNYILDIDTAKSFASGIADYQETRVTL